MDVGSIATALVAGRAAQTQIAIAGKMLKMNAESAASVAQLLDAAAQNGAKMAAGLAEGIGGALDITV